jgi:hemolysin III
MHTDEHRYSRRKICVYLCSSVAKNWRFILQGVGPPARTLGMSSRPQSAREELANSVVHGAALVAAVAAIPGLIQMSQSAQSSAASLAGSMVFAATLVLLFVCSTLYHALPDGRARLIALRLDHGAIYLFIAGSYTPFAVASLNSTFEWLQLAGVWACALLGFILKACGRLSHPLLSTGLYVLMGWTVLSMAAPLIERLPQYGAYWLVAGGIAYSVGVIFFVLDSRLRYAHAIWHGFVVAGTSCHFVSVVNLNH